MSASRDQMGFNFGGVPANEGEKVDTRCAHCRQQIAVPAWYVAATQLHFCGATCRQAWTQAQPSFEVRLGPTAKRRGANWELQAREARERDGFAWMLHGDMGEDNTTRMVMKKSDAKDPSQWIESGPHMMVFPKDPASLSKFTDDFTRGEPYVMFPGSDYAHLMIPVEGYYHYQPESSPIHSNEQ